MKIISEPLDYRDDGQAFEAFVARDADQTSPRPAVLIAHMWGGRVDFVCRKAEQMAELGYVGVAMDLYGKGVIGTTPEASAALMKPLMADRALLQRRLARALEEARRLPGVREDRIAVIGFCFGGLCALEMARSRDDLSGAVSFHGLLDPPDNLPSDRFGCPVLVLHGREDPMVPPARCEALRKELARSGCDWQFIEFGRAMHAFTNPAANDPEAGTVYDARADRRAWAYMIRFLGEVLA